MPTLETEIHQAYADHPDFAAIAMSSSTLGPEDPDVLADYVDTMGLTMPVLVDWDVSVYSDYEISCPDEYAPYPREYIIDGDGIVRYTACQIDTNAIAAVLDDLLP